MSVLEDDEIEIWVTFLKAIGEVDAGNAYTKGAGILAGVQSISLRNVNSPAPTITTS
jgi:hypothetical protein